MVWNRGILSYLQGHGGSIWIYTVRRGRLSRHYCCTRRHTPRSAVLYANRGLALLKLGAEAEAEQVRVSVRVRVRARVRARARARLGRGGRGRAGW